MFHYNTAVTNVNTIVIRNTYVNNSVVNRTVVNRVSYNGGSGGTTAFPRAAERVAMSEHGEPAVAATSRPGAFNGTGAVSARAAGANANRPNPSTNPHSDRPPNARTNKAFNSKRNRPLAFF